MALHKQETNNPKPKKFYPPNLTLYPTATDKFLIQYDKKAKCFRVTHYSKWGFRGQWNVHGVKTNIPYKKHPKIPMVRRNEWTYQRRFENEIEALKFAKQKAEDRKMNKHDTVFLLELDGDWSM